METGLLGGRQVSRGEKVTSEQVSSLWSPSKRREMTLEKGAAPGLCRAPWAWTPHVLAPDVSAPQMHLPAKCQHI